MITLTSRAGLQRLILPDTRARPACSDKDHPASSLGLAQKPMPSAGQVAFKAAGADVQAKTRCMIGRSCDQSTS
jgi:hypothetical protein